MNYIDTTLFLPSYLKDVTERLLDRKIGYFTQAEDVDDYILDNLSKPDMMAVVHLNNLMNRLIFNTETSRGVRKHFHIIKYRYSGTYGDVLTVLRDTTLPEKYEYKHSDLFEIKTFSLQPVDNTPESSTIVNDNKVYRLLQDVRRNMLVIYVKEGLSNALGYDLNSQDVKLFIRSFSSYVFDYIKTNIGLPEAKLSMYNYTRLY